MRLHDHEKAAPDTKFKQQYAIHLKHLELQGLERKTINAYARAVRHVLPRRFRRARNFGFLHPNSKRLIQLVHLLLKVDLSTAMAYFKPRPTLTCTGCGGAMKVIRTRLPPARARRHHPPDRLTECMGM